MDGASELPQAPGWRRPDVLRSLMSIVEYLHATEKCVVDA